MTAKATLLIEEYFKIDNTTGKTSNRQREITAELLSDLKQTLSLFELDDVPQELMVDYSSPNAKKEALTSRYDARRDLTKACNRARFAQRLMSKECDVALEHDGGGVRFIEDSGNPFPIAVTIPCWMASSSPEDFAASMNRKLSAAREEATRKSA